MAARRLDRADATGQRRLQAVIDQPVAPIRPVAAEPLPQPADVGPGPRGVAAQARPPQSLVARLPGPPAARGPGPPAWQPPGVVAALDEPRHDNVPGEYLDLRIRTLQREMERLPPELDATLRLAPTDRGAALRGHADRLADDVAGRVPGPHPGIQSDVRGCLARSARGQARRLLGRQLSVERTAALQCGDALVPVARF